MQTLPAQALPAVNSGSSSLRIAIYRRKPRLPLLLRGPAARRPGAR